MLSQAFEDNGGFEIDCVLGGNGYALEWLSRAPITSIYFSLKLG